jgi:beta-lactam-binding protein with PASTA domain
LGKDGSTVKKLLAALMIAGVVGLGCGPATPSGKTTKTPTVTHKEEKSATGSHMEETKVKGHESKTKSEDKPKP